MSCAIQHTCLGASPFSRARKLLLFIKNGKIALGGNMRLKIYGTLDCGSGKRLKLENRIFFKTEADAISLGYRPCGHCMKAAYKSWRSQNTGSIAGLGTSIQLRDRQM